MKRFIKNFFVNKSYFLVNHLIKFCKFNFLGVSFQTINIIKDNKYA